MGQVTMPAHNPVVSGGASQKCIRLEGYFLSLGRNILATTIDHMLKRLHVESKAGVDYERKRPWGALDEVVREVRRRLANPERAYPMGLWQNSV